MNEDNHLRPTPGWAAASGFVNVRHQQAETDRQYGHDRALVAERIARYSWSFDERDRRGLADCFTPAGVWEGHIMGADTVGPFVGRDAIADFLAQFWELQQDQRRHMFTNVVTNGFSSEGVSAHAYLLLTSTEAGAMTPITAGAYRFELQRTDDKIWRIARLTANFDAPF
jgi:hypothetical protein